MNRLNAVQLAALMLLAAFGLGGRIAQEEL
jgi:hypothetical protein